MVTHETKKINSGVVMMWCDANIKTEQTIKVNVKKGIKINPGDRISVGSDEHPAFYNINSIDEKRDSTLNGWDYITAKATRTTQ